MFSCLFSLFFLPLSVSLVVVWLLSSHFIIISSNYICKITVGLPACNNNVILVCISIYYQSITYFFMVSYSKAFILSRNYWRHICSDCLSDILSIYLLNYYISMFSMMYLQNTSCVLVSFLVSNKVIEKCYIYNITLKKIITFPFYLLQGGFILCRLFNNKDWPPTSHRIGSFMSEETSLDKRVWGISGGMKFSSSDTFTILRSVIHILNHINILKSVQEQLIWLKLKFFC